MDDISISSLLQSPSPEGTRFSQKPIALMRDEASLFHHYTLHLGRWLDCTSASRTLTLGVPEMARQCPALCNALLCFAARHRRQEKTADVAYQRCIALLLDRLNEDSASHDDMLLTAVILLHFADQLNGAISQ
jgi:hypothetical protein